MFSVALDAPVDIAHEEVRGEEAYCPEHEREAEARHAHVPEVEGSLHEALHVGLDLKVVYTIPGDKEARRPERLVSVTLSTLSSSSYITLPEWFLLTIETNR